MSSHEHPSLSDGKKRVGTSATCCGGRRRTEKGGDRVLMLLMRKSPFAKKGSQKDSSPVGAGEQRRDHRSGRSDGNTNGKEGKPRS